MNIAVIGASAGVGLILVHQLLERGHAVTTLSRTLEALPEHPALTKVCGSALNAADVTQAVGTADAILVTLGTGSSTKATGLYPNAARALLEAMKSKPTRATLIVLTGFGAGNSWDYNPWPIRILFRIFLKDIYAEKTQMEQLIAAGYPSAMFVRPGRLTSGALTKKYRVTTMLDENTRIGAISRNDVADFMARQAEHPEFLGRHPAIGG